MPKKRDRRTFQVRPRDVEGIWESNDGRYREYAHQLLQEHVALCEEVVGAWPIDPGLGLDPSQHPTLWAIALRRNQTADSVRIFAAMAVEGFINFYGVLRLGEEVYNEQFERMGLVPKLRALLLISDQLDVPESDPMVDVLKRIAADRNGLVHPKTRTVTGPADQFTRTLSRVPDAAIEAVDRMEKFFAAFKEAVPLAESHLNRRPKGSPGKA